MKKVFNHFSQAALIGVSLGLPAAALAAATNAADLTHTPSATDTPQVAAAQQDSKASESGDTIVVTAA